MKNHMIGFFGSILVQQAFILNLFDYSVIVRHYTVMFSSRITEVLGIFMLLSGLRFL